MTSQLADSQKRIAEIDIGIQEFLGFALTRYFGIESLRDTRKSH
jgi:hypothetical protein